ncbi:MAG: hypothetical protein V1833_04455 [Elusimicrobiota bacterium]
MNKKTKLLFIFLTVLGAVAIYFLFHSPGASPTANLLGKKGKIVPVELSYEKIVPSDVSVIVRFDNLDSVWSDFKKTNFYVHFKDFSKWFFREMPSETLGFTNDIKDIQKTIGFELNEKNILNFVGKKILFSAWLENPDDKKFLLISQLNSPTLRPASRDKTKIGVDPALSGGLLRRSGVDEYKGMTINILDENRYWCRMENKFVMSNDIGIIKRVIGFSADTTNNSINNDVEFKKNIMKINSPNYIYIKPQKISLKKFGLIKNEVETLMFSVKFEKGIRLESYIFQKQPLTSSHSGFASDLSKIFTKMTEKNYFKFPKPVSVDFTPKKYGGKIVVYLPITDLSFSEWSEIFSGFQKIIYKKILFEREKVTHRNLMYLKETLNIYNSKMGRYPNKLGSLIDEYLNEIPQELLTKSNSVVSIQDGLGGWFYENGKVQLNVFGTDSAGNFYTQW